MYLGLYVNGAKHSDICVKYLYSFSPALIPCWVPEMGLCRLLEMQTEKSSSGSKLQTWGETIDILTTSVGVTEMPLFNPVKFFNTGWPGRGIYHYIWNEYRISKIKRMLVFIGTLSLSLSSSLSLSLRYESSTLIHYKELSSTIIQMWVSQSVSQWGIGNTCPDLHFLQYIKAWMSFTDPVSSITNCYRLIVSYTDPVHSFIIS